MKRKVQTGEGYFLYVFSTKDSQPEYVEKKKATGSYLLEIADSTIGKKMSKILGQASHKDNFQMANNQVTGTQLH